MSKEDNKLISENIQAKYHQLKKEVPIITLVTISFKDISNNDRPIGANASVTKVILSINCPIKVEKVDVPTNFLLLFYL